MKWAKIPTEFLYLADKEITAIAKFVMLYGILERVPTRSECLRNMSVKQLEMVQKHFAIISKAISADINIAQYDRTRKKQKKAEICEKKPKTPTEIPTENLTEVPTEIPKDRENRENRENKKQTKSLAKQVLPVHQIIADYLADNLSVRLNRKISNRGWADEIRKLCESGNIDPPRVQDALEWHFRKYDRPYRIEIQSARTLREKFSRLETAYLADEPDLPV